MVHIVEMVCQFTIQYEMKYVACLNQMGMIQFNKCKQLKHATLITAKGAHTFFGLVGLVITTARLCV